MLQKILFISFSLVGIIAVQAQEFIKNNLRFEVITNNDKAGCVRVLGFEVETEDSVLLIPETVSDGLDTYKITEIAPAAFSKNRVIKEVVLTNQIDSIGDAAFEECEHLQKVRLPKHLEMISNYLFHKCVNLKHVEMPINTKVIGTAAFSFCLKLPELILPETTEDIRQSAFSYCKSFETFVLPASIKAIRNAAFQECSSLKILFAKFSNPAALNCNCQVFTNVPIGAYLVVLQDQVYNFKDIGFWRETDFNIIGEEDFKKLTSMDKVISEEVKIENDNGLFVSTNKSEKVVVYDIKGRLVFTSTSSKGKQQLPLAKGIYIIQVGEKQFKIFHI